MALVGSLWEEAKQHEEYIMLFRSISTLIPAVKLSIPDIQVKENTKVKKHQLQKSESCRTATLDAAATVLVRNHEVVSVISRTLSKRNDGEDRKIGVQSVVALTSNNKIDETVTDSDESNGGDDDNDDSGSPKKYRATRNPERDHKGRYLNCQLNSSLNILVPTINCPEGVSPELCIKNEALLSYLETNMKE